MMRLGAVARRWSNSELLWRYRKPAARQPANRPPGGRMAARFRAREVDRGGQSETSVSKAAARIEFPADFARIRDTNLAAATEIQSRVRDQFEAFIAKGYAATGIHTHNGVATYILEPSAEIAGLLLRRSPSISRVTLRNESPNP